MGILSWLFGDSDKNLDYDQIDVDKEKVTLPGPGTYSLDIVGESHYQKALNSICGGRTECGVDYKVIAIIVPEDDNPHDSKAVRIDVYGETVGHLSKKLARDYRARLKEAGHPGIKASCRAKIIGGWDRGGGDRGSFGVKLDLPTGD